MSKNLEFTTKYLDKLIGEATTDAYNESEQAGGFFVMIEENLALPFVTQLLGQEVTVAKVDITERDQIVAICVRGKLSQTIPILDLPMPDPLPRRGVDCWLSPMARYLEWRSTNDGKSDGKKS